MKVLAWNLGHQVREKKNLDGLADLFSSLNIDTLLLNEFVDGPSRDTFRTSLTLAGYRYQLVSETPARHNQVFAASRTSFSLGDIQPPTFDGSAISNFLHIQFDTVPIELVGLRVPAYAKAADRRAYREELLAIMRSASTRTIAFAGDLNEEPFAKSLAPERLTMRFAGCSSYTVANPVGDWSYIGWDARWRTRIDHVLYTDAVRVSDPVYISSFGGRRLAGTNAERPVSDHAALVFTVGAEGLRVSDAGHCSQ